MTPLETYLKEVRERCENTTPGISNHSVAFAYTFRTDIEKLLRMVEKATEALEWISDERKRDHQESDDYTRHGCVMFKAYSTLEQLTAIAEGREGKG